MTPGVPGAGIGGLFYLASTLLLPFRSLVRRLRGQPDSLGAREAIHSLAIASSVVAGLWLTGWVLALMVPDEILRSVSTSAGGAARIRTVLPVATFATAVGTLLLVLIAVEIARFAEARRNTRGTLPKGRST
jgi:hypothetical protein